MDVYGFPSKIYTEINHFNKIITNRHKASLNFDQTATNDQKMMQENLKDQKCNGSKGEFFFPLFDCKS